jgi:hypothetical protein
VEAFPNLRGRRTATDPVSNDQITAYLERVRSSMHVSGVQRRRALEEIESHLEDGVAAHMEDGATRDEAIDRVIQDLGSPEAVARAFTDENTPPVKVSGAVRWLPMTLPLVLAVIGVAYVAWSLVDVVRGDLTAGEHLLQRSHLRTGLVDAATGAVLACASYASIGRADRDRAWRWAAWACAVCAVCAALVALG